MHASTSPSTGQPSLLRTYIFKLSYRCEQLISYALLCRHAYPSSKSSNTVLLHCMLSKHNPLIYLFICISKQKLDSKHLKQSSSTDRMFFILIAWLLTLLTFVIWLRALHTIPIHTHTLLQRDSQKLQLQNFMYITKLLLPVSLGLLALHFILENEERQDTPPETTMTTNTSVDTLNAVVMHVRNVTV